MTSSRRLSLIVGVLLVASLVVAVLLVYLNNRYIPSGNDVDLNEFIYDGQGEIYRSEAYGFGFRYPKDWSVRASEGEIEVVPLNAQDGRPLLISVRNIALDAYKEELEEERGTTVYREDKNVPGYEDATELKVSTASGLDTTALFIRHDGKSYVVQYHDFNETHQDILGSFQFLN